jgi:hypothetical protein
VSAVGAFPSKSHLRRARSPALPCIVAALGGEACACRRARARSALRTVSFSRRFQMWVMWVMWVMVPNFFVTYSLSVVLSGGSRARPRYVRDRYQKPCYGGRYSSYAIRVKRFQIRGLAEKKRKPFQLQRLSRKSCNGLTSPTSPTCEWFTLYYVYIILQPKPPCLRSILPLRALREYRACSPSARRSRVHSSSLCSTFASTPQCMALPQSWRICSGVTCGRRTPLGSKPCSVRHSSAVRKRCRWTA